tara:strand:- start:4781 stop:5044 length:264 start_codon:yes stop_codon:yes gene_type:complete
MNNLTLLNEKVPTETELKEIIVNYVGKVLNPNSDDITIQQVIEVFSKEFPEFLLALAEENWINGYTQALKDVEFRNKNNEKLYQKQE